MRYLSTPPAIPVGALAAGLQPVLAARGGLVLRPWKPDDAPVFLAAYQDPEIIDAGRPPLGGGGRPR